MSLGCRAIFPLGGKSRDDFPLAMFLRSGDVVLMVGEVRERFHNLRFLVIANCDGDWPSYKMNSPVGYFFFHWFRIMIGLLSS
ncbi:DNA-(apurinic or apyrimidinic site) lyase [Sarracenia purpurea var. burkii]